MEKHRADGAAMRSQFVFGWKSESSFRKSWPDLPVLSKRGTKEMAIPTDHGNLSGCQSPRFCRHPETSHLKSEKNDFETWQMYSLVKPEMGLFFHNWSDAIWLITYN